MHILGTKNVVSQKWPKNKVVQFIFMLSNFQRFYSEFGGPLCLSDNYISWKISSILVRAGLDLDFGRGLYLKELTI